MLSPTLSPAPALGFRSEIQPIKWGCRTLSLQKFEKEQSRNEVPVRQSLVDRVLYGCSERPSLWEAWKAKQGSCTRPATLGHSVGFPGSLHFQAACSFSMMCARSCSTSCQRIFSRIFALRCSKCHLDPSSRYCKAISISSRTSFPGSFGRHILGRPAGMFGGGMGSGRFPNQTRIRFTSLSVRNPGILTRTANTAGGALSRYDQ